MNSNDQELDIASMDWDEHGDCFEEEEITVKDLFSSPALQLQYNSRISASNWARWKR